MKITTESIGKIFDLDEEFAYWISRSDDVLREVSMDLSDLKVNAILLKSEWTDEDRLYLAKKISEANQHEFYNY